MLAVGMILSVGASAQGTITHRFPEVKFLYNNKEYILPAWDVMFGSGSDISMTRVQAKESYEYDKDQTVKAKIVSRFGITADEDFFTSFGGSTGATIKIVKVDANGNTVLDDDGNVMYVENGVDDQGNVKYDFTVGSVTYQQALPNHTFNSTSDAVQKLFDSNSTPTYEQNEYTITTSKVYKGVTFDIDEIGAWAYRGQKATSGAFATIAANKVIIPKEIKRIGIGAFSFIPSKEIEFADDSEIDSLSRAIFMLSSDIKKITLPASLTQIRGAALGGLPNLKRIIFKGNVPPAFISDKFEANAYTCDPFSKISRFTGASNLTPAKCIIEVPLGTVGSYAAVQYATDKSLKNFALCSKITLGATGKMTYCSEEDFTVMQYNTETKGWEDGALKAYYVKNSTDDVNTEIGTVYLTKITGESKIPGWSETDDFGVFLRGEANESYDIFYPYDKMSDKLTMAGTTNCLKGVITRTYITIPDPNIEPVEEAEKYSYFILSATTGNFNRIMSSGWCKENRAYIVIRDGGYESMGALGSKELTISFPEETGITSHEMKSVQNDAWYTLQGVQVNQPSKGIFIKNGKKYIVK